jgi:hypothetical protein
MGQVTGELMVSQGDVISYLDMCREEGVNLQRGMNFRLKGGISVVLMSLRLGAPYADRIEDDGHVLIYEGHDIPQKKGGPKPKRVNQEKYNPGGGLTQNGLFHDAAMSYKTGHAAPELVKVYEKIKAGIWVYNGIFRLIDAWQETSQERNVYKFKLALVDSAASPYDLVAPDIEHNRLIPTSVKIEVWKRDKGRCVKCGRQDNLHFDHIIPYTKGGSSLVAENIQILCARHNLRKKDRIE